MNIIKKLSVKDVLTTDQAGLSVVHLCVKYNAIKELLMLLDNFSEQQQIQLINQRTSGICSKTPLQLASDNQNDRVTKFLIDRGAEITENEIEKMSKNFKNNPFFLSYLNELTE